MMWMGLLMILPRSGKHVISYNDSLALFTNTTYHLQSVLDDMMSVMGITCDEHQQEWPHCAMGEPESLFYQTDFKSSSNSRTSWYK